MGKQNPAGFILVAILITRPPHLLSTVAMARDCVVGNIL